MYNNSGMVLPQTGMIASGAFGLTGHQSIALGLFCVVVGIMLFKLVRFKAKDIKNN